MDEQAKVQNENVLENEKGMNIAQDIQLFQEIMQVVQMAQSLDTNANGQTDLKDLVALVKSFDSDWTSITGKLSQIKSIVGGDVAAVEAKLAPAVKK